VLAEINPDGTENRPTFSANPAVDAKIHLAELAFGKRDFTKAIALYQEALAIEPGHYKATLYLGDSYFASEQYVPAITWFIKATELDPNQETAYRYCGDALMRTGKKDLALEQYLQAVIANPYSGYSWRALEHACRALALTPWVHADKLPTAEVKPDQDGNPQIAIPKDFTIFNIVYSTARSQWQVENGTGRKGQATVYRQSLTEEAAALRALLTFAAEIRESGQPPPAEIAAAFGEMAPVLAQLKDIEDAGLLEAHILLFRANQDIATDYAEYRDENRGKLREHLRKFYLHLP
jgi:tetratricopeptide (TPR) repeat protein